MSEAEKITQLNQGFSLGELVVLFKLDASNILDINGNTVGILYFTPGPLNGAIVQFGGISYQPIPMEADGFEWNGQAAFPQPKIRISNINRALTATLVNAGHLVGAKIYRIRTYSQFLDGQPQADSSATFEVDIYNIEQLNLMSKVYVEWILSSSIDQEGKQLPGRQCFQTVCTKRYRFYDSKNAVFVTYPDNPCPYAGGAYFQINGSATTNPALDLCSKDIKGCKLRFGQTAELPFGGFPGMARV